MTVAPATPAPAAPPPTLPTVQPGVLFVTRGGHLCDTFQVVRGVPRTYECQHHHVLRGADVRDAFLRAGETR